MMGLMVVNGATAGGFSPISIFGSIVNGVVERNDLAGNPTLLFFSSLIFNTLLSVIVFFAFGGRDLLNRRVDTEPEPTERFKRETTESGAPTIAGGAVDIAAEAPELDRDRILTLVGIAALVALALMPGIDWDVGFVAVSIAVVLSLAMPQRHQERGRQGRLADRAADLRHRHVRRAAGGDRDDRVARPEGGRGRHAAAGGAADLLHRRRGVRVRLHHRHPRRADPARRARSSRRARSAPSA